MKFYELPIGQRFELDGKTYMKTSPLIASLESDGSKILIKRAVSVKALSGEHETAGSKRKLVEPDFMQLINRYHDENIALLERYSGMLDDALLARLEDSFTELKNRIMEDYGFDS